MSGIGKTIEACMVLKGVLDRGLVRRALILAPPRWSRNGKGELSVKFGLNPHSPDTADFRRDRVEYWTREPLVVASIAMRGWTRMLPRSPRLLGTW